MSHTNTTPNYNLPQFLTTDKPAWLTDINGAFSDIDTGIHNAQSDATTAGNNATQAISDASAAATAASTADAKGAGAVASIADTFDPTAVYSEGDYVMYNSLLYICSADVITPGPWTGSANWTRTTTENVVANAVTDLNTAISQVNDISPAAVTPIASTRFNYLSINKMGNMVQIVFMEPKGFNANAESNADYVIPADLRPREEIRVDFTAPASTDYIRVRVRVNGNITVYNYSNNTGVLNMNGAISYFI